MTQNNVIDCPICNSLNTSYTSYNDSWATVESHFVCFNCGYEEDQAYGDYAILVKGQEFIYDYRTPMSGLFMKKLNKAIYQAKRNYKKHHKIYKNCHKTIYSKI